MARHFISATVATGQIQAKRKVSELSKPILILILISVVISPKIKTKDQDQGLRLIEKHWRPAFAGRQNQTQGVEARYTKGVTISGRVMEGLFAFTVMMEAVGGTNHWC